MLAPTVEERRARRLGGLTQAVGGFVLLTALAFLLASTDLLRPRGDHFGFSAFGPIVFMTTIVPVAAVVGLLGFLYMRAGHCARARPHHRRHHLAV